MFVETKQGTSLRIDAVTEFARGPGDSIRVRLENGREHDVDFSRWCEARSSISIKCVPAEPGTYQLISGCHDTGEFWYGKTPVIAWRIDSEGHVDPISPQGAAGEAGSATVLCPDGSVHSFDTSWPTIEQWAEDRAREELYHRLPKRRSRLRLVETDPE